MQTKQYTTIDKSAWPRGPWDDEPDKVQWQDEATGLPCLIDRKPTGFLCGYVGVPESHPFHGKFPEHIEVRLMGHGRVNFGAACNPNATESSGVCHVPDPGETDSVWWLGFDCGHGYDLEPAAPPMPYPLSEQQLYRDLHYVRRYVTLLAGQIAVHA